MFLGFLFLAGGGAVYMISESLRPMAFGVANAFIDLARTAILYNDGTGMGTKARQGGKRPLKSGFMQSYYLVTITNKADVLKGLKPIVKDVGPYAFSEYSRNFRVKKSATAKTVTTSSLTYYVYESTYSCALSEEGLATTKRDDLQVCVNWKTDTITTYNPLWHAVMKLAHASGMGEAFGAVLLGAKGLSLGFTALLPAVGNSATALANKLGMQQAGHADCCGVGSSLVDNAQLTAALGGVVPEFSCWTRRKRCSDGTETAGIPAYNNGGTGGTMSGSVLTSAQSVTVYDFFRNGTSVPTHCTGLGGYPELNAEVDRLNALTNAALGNPAGVGSAHPLFALYMGIVVTSNKLKVYGEYGFSYGQFRALYTYIIYAVIEGAKAAAAQAVLAGGGNAATAAATATGLGATICGANPYNGILSGVTGCTIMNDFLDFIINGQGRAFAWNAGTILASVAAGNPADTYITELTAEQMLWTGYTSKFGADLNLAPQPGQNILGFGRKTNDGTQIVAEQPTKWPTGISAPGGGSTGPWDVIVQLGNGKYRAANAEVTKENAYYEKCGLTNICVGGCTASTSEYDTMTHSYKFDGTVAKDMAGEYVRRWGSKFSGGRCTTPPTGCNTAKTWNATKRTYAKPLKIEGLKVGSVWPKYNGFKKSQNAQTVTVPGSADQHFAKDDMMEMLVLGRPLSLKGTAPTIQYHGKKEKFQEFRTIGANLTTWLDSNDKLYGNCFYNVDPEDGQVEALLSAPHFAGCKDSAGAMKTSAGGATFATYAGTTKTHEELAVAYSSKLVVSPLMGLAVGGSFKFGSYFHIRSSSLNALHPNMCSTTDLGAGISWPSTLVACASGNDWIVPYYWVTRESLPTKATVEIFGGARGLLGGGLALISMMGLGAYAMLGIGACCCLTGMSMGGGSDEVKP
jgi:hypothetical protein